MKLSVLIPLYNAEKLISNCLESLINQDLDKNEYEVLILDDGSTDTSKKIVEEYTTVHKNIHLFSKHNEGVYVTRNKLLKLATGNYVYFMDADDYVAHHSLKTILHTAITSNLDIIGFKTTITNSTHNTTFIKPKTEISTNIKITTGSQYLEDHKNIRVEIWWYFIKRDFIVSHEIKFHESEYHMDVLFTYQSFLKAKKVAFVPVSIYRYFQSEGSIMRNKSTKSIQKRITNGMIMLSKFSYIINTLEHNPKQHSKKLTINLKCKRDAFTFFLIINMVRHKLHPEIIKNNIALLKKDNAYPLNNFISSEYNSLKFKILHIIINNKFILIPISKLYKLIS